MHLKPLLPAIALLALATACSRQQPQPSQPVAEPTTREQGSTAQSEPVALTATMGQPATEPGDSAPAIASVRPPSAEEDQRIRSDGTGLAAAAACHLLAPGQIEAYARRRREELLSAGVDAAAYDAAYAAAFGTVQTKYPQATAEVQKQVCTHAETFAGNVRKAERSVAGTP